MRDRRSYRPAVPEALERRVVLSGMAWPAHLGAGRESAALGPGVATLAKGGRSVAPLSSLTLTGKFQAGAPTTVTFTGVGKTKYHVQETPVSVSSNSLVVNVPVFIDRKTGTSAAGDFQVMVSQHAGRHTTKITALKHLHIDDLPQTGQPPGALAIQALQNANAQIKAAIATLQAISSRSKGIVDVSSALAQLQALDQQTASQADMLFQVQTGKVASVSLGTYHGMALVVDKAALNLLDRVTVAGGGIAVQAQGLTPMNGSANRSAAEPAIVTTASSSIVSQEASSSNPTLQTAITRLTTALAIGSVIAGLAIPSLGATPFIAAVAILVVGNSIAPYLAASIEAGLQSLSQLISGTPDPVGSASSYIQTTSDASSNVPLFQQAVSAAEQAAGSAYAQAAATAQAAQQAVASAEDRVTAYLPILVAQILQAEAPAPTPTPMPTPVPVPVPQSPSIGLSTHSLSFTAEEAMGNPDDQSFTVVNSGGGVLHPTAVTSNPRVKVSFSSFGTTGTYRVSVDTSGISPGSYQERITISDPTANNSPQVVLVNITVTASAPCNETDPIGSGSEDGDEPDCD